MKRCDAFAAIFRNAEANLRVFRVEGIQPGSIVLHLAEIPAEIVVIGNHIGNMVERLSFSTIERFAMVVSLV